MNAYNRKGEWLSIALPAPVELTYEAVSSVIPMIPKMWNKLKANGGVRMQGTRLMLHLFPSEHDSPPITPEWGELTIAYEDDYCLVVVKSVGMPVHGITANQPGTLAGRVAAYYAETGQACRVRHIHRLDVDTSGLVLYAKNEWAHQQLDEQMRAKSIHRTYLAVAEGRFSRKKGTINQPIGRDRHHNARRRVSSSGDAAVTHYKVMEQFSHGALVELSLETGRTHQIRVHLSYLGHPLIGDKLYGGSDKLLSHQALHGYKLSFTHPLTADLIEVEAPLPNEIEQVMKQL
ncbi:RluA family pseudouridine synthase [Paenibacillus albiflavus]|uniref:Pseudouridine synthase n=1 Tax=Paenibacillus albiflavus TaxID=2545760 RepID=A0A4R4E895_9BACL|nr:RluA family pseudouridine synthase [Paenibacillus albiflavus]TCZ75173.1 RluA family pseudouridine synthase [Paenibacillus albiflavus]